MQNITAPKQQIIAHDDEVYDMAFSNEAHIFGSVGGDGSLRIFDLRCVHAPVARLASHVLTHAHVL